MNQHTDAVTFTATLTANEARAFAQFLTFARPYDYRDNALSDEEASMMHLAGLRIRDAIKKARGQA